MLKEAIESFTALARQSADVQELKIAGDSPDRVHIVGTDGKVTQIAKAAPHRQIELLAMADLVELAVKPFDTAWGNRAIFYSAERVTLVLNRLNGYELATLRLTQSNEAAYFANRITTPAVSVKELVEALLTTLRKTRPESDLQDFVKAVGNLNVTGGTDASASAARTGSSLSKGVREAIADPAALPADLQSFNVRPFAVPDMKFRAQLTCTLLPITSDARWRFQPLQDSWLDFTADALEYVAHCLKEAVDAKVPIYCGSWNVKTT